jgi:hypothetical protein
MSLLAVAPALPLHAAGKYVAGAYVVFVVVILIYVVIMAVRLGRTERALVELNHELARRDETVGARDGVERPPNRDREPAPAGRPGDSSL